jgi:hypothetical protein
MKIWRNQEMNKFALMLWSIFPRKIRHTHVHGSKTEYQFEFIWFGKKIVSSVEDK